MTKFIAKINGFSITQRMIGHKDTYFMAYRKNNNGADKLFTANEVPGQRDRCVEVQYIHRWRYGFPPCCLF